MKTGKPPWISILMICSKFVIICTLLCSRIKVKNWPNTRRSKSLFWIFRYYLQFSFRGSSHLISLLLLHLSLLERGLVVQFDCRSVWNRLLDQTSLGWYCEEYGLFFKTFIYFDSFLFCFFNSHIQWMGVRDIMLNRWGVLFACESPIFMQHFL